jgi:hypothetical protein
VISFFLAFPPISYVHFSSPPFILHTCSSHPPWLGEEWKLWGSSSFTQRIRPGPRPFVALRNKLFFTSRCCNSYAQPPSWRTTSCWLSATAYSIYSQLPFISSREKSVGIPTSYELDDGGDGNSSPGRVMNFLFSTSSRTGLESTQPHIQWVPGTLSSGVNRPGVQLTTHLQQVPRLRKYRTIHPFPHTPS